MEYVSFCSVRLKRFNVMNLIYPFVIAIAGIFVIGIPIGLFTGILDTVIFKNGTLVSIGFGIIIFLWSVLVILCAYSFFAVLKDLSYSIDVLCVGDEQRSPSIWKVLLLNLVTLGIYKFIYFYRLSTRIKDATKKYETGMVMSPETMLLFTILGSVVGGGFLVGGSLLVDDVNNLAEISNQENGYSTDDYENWGIKNITFKKNKSKKAVKN